MCIDSIGKFNACCHSIAASIFKTASPIPHYVSMATTSTEMAEETTHTVSDGIVTKFATYEDFLDSQITQTDLYYLEVC